MNSFCYYAKYKYVKTANVKNCKNMYKPPTFILDFSEGKLILGKALELTYYLHHETSSPSLLNYLEMFYYLMDRHNISDATENLKVCITFKIFVKQIHSAKTTGKSQCVLCKLLGDKPVRS